MFANIGPLTSGLFFIIWFIKHFVCFTPVTCSYYGSSWDGRLTASGTTYYSTDLTCAHRYLPLGTLVELKNAKGKTICGRITDVGPFIKGRQFDLSEQMFSSLSDVEYGILYAEYRIVGYSTSGLVWNY